jgi:hypothetical protein
VQTNVSIAALEVPLWYIRALLASVTDVRSAGLLAAGTEKKK